jgi:hypothetical protein
MRAKTECPEVVCSAFHVKSQKNQEKTTTSNVTCWIFMNATKRNRLFERIAPKTNIFKQVSKGINTNILGNYLLPTHGKFHLKNTMKRTLYQYYSFNCWTPH